jgi:hypothetical protein
VYQSQSIQRLLKVVAMTKPDHVPAEHRKPSLLEHVSTTILEI